MAGRNEEEQWEFMQHLSDRSIRDIGFVIMGPPLLLGSNKLPTVKNNVFQPKCVEWLKELDANFVRTWFASQKPTTRLGEHYAKCVEFVLRFSPAFKLDSLFYSQQVLESTEKEDSSEILECNGLEYSKDLEKYADKYATRHVKKLLRKLQKNKRSVVNTVGEFDFVFRISSPCEIERTDIEHWEVSVKYLLYVGPWEIFGCTTPEYSIWKKLQNNPERQIKDEEEFFGCFLGPHVGETLADRRERMKNQLTLSSKSSALEMLRILFESSNIHVCSKALLQGYLFYEPDLWKMLSSEYSLRESTSLNLKHWKGWWMHVEGFVEFAWDCSSKWYIIPKKEWLSPIMIREPDERLLSKEGLIEMAAKVSEEAAKLEKDRMRRFLVAEMQVEYDSIWREVSRGFIVEDTWPDTKTYAPYGFLR